MCSTEWLSTVDLERRYGPAAAGPFPRAPGHHPRMKSRVLAGMQRAGPNDSGELILASAMRGYQSKPSLRKEKAPNPWHLLMASRHPQVDEILPSHSCEFEPISGATGLQKLLQGRRFCLRNENFCR